MDTESGAGPLHSLIPLTDFKALLGVDDREDALSRYCLITATYTIEHYCKRRFFMKKHFERFEFAGDLLLPLREYPVLEIVALYALYHASEPKPVEPDFYTLQPEPEPENEEGSGLDIPHTLRLSPALGRLPGLTAFKAVYRAGYGCGNAPADLASACLELAAWNMARYRGRRIGMTGNVRGAGKDSEHLEASMPENVRLLLEPYKRVLI
jgi:hypothetical protein